MKKLLALLLSLLVVFSLVACGGSDANDDVADYVDEHGDELLDDLEEGFSTTGMDCESSIKASGDGVEVKIKIGGIDDLSKDQKEQIQDTYDNMDSTWEAALEEIQDEESAVKFLRIIVCEEDGDKIATIYTKG